MPFCLHVGQPVGHPVGLVSHLPGAVGHVGHPIGTLKGTLVPLKDTIWGNGYLLEGTWPKPNWVTDRVTDMKAKFKKIDGNAFIKIKKWWKCLHLGHFALMLVTMYIFNIKSLLAVNVIIWPRAPLTCPRTFNLSNKAVGSYLIFHNKSFGSSSSLCFKVPRDFNIHT